MTYPDPRVAGYLTEQFVPVRLMVPQSPEEVQQHRVTWTPTLMAQDANGVEQDRWVGYLPPEEFLPRLKLARGRVAFNAGRFDDAAEIFEEVAREHGTSLVAPEALYWLGVARYKGEGKREGLMGAWKELWDSHKGSEWAKKVCFVFEKEKA